MAVRGVGSFIETASGAGAMEPGSIAGYLHSIYPPDRLSWTLKPVLVKGPVKGGGSPVSPETGFVLLHHGETKADPGGAGRKVVLLALGVAFLVTMALAPPHLVGEAMGAVPNQGLAYSPGADSSRACVHSPCATVIADQGGARIVFSLGKESVEPIQPATYYTDLLRVSNPTGSTVTVTSVAVSGVSEARPGDLGALSVYYCSTQTDDPTAGCEGSFSTSAPNGGVVFTGSDRLGPGATRYVELVGFAGLSAQIGDAISFTIRVAST